jgi:LacI family transcriptional regulator
VSLVLNYDSGISISEATRQRVLEAARELDYRPNAAGRSLRRQRTGLAGLMLRRTPRQENANAFLSPVMDGITSVLGPAGFQLLVEAVDETRPDAYVNLLRGARVDGIIFSRATPDDEPLIRLDADHHAVVLWGQLAGSNLPFVDVDNARGARSAVEHLVSLGHKRIACITNGPIRYVGSESDDRLRGYREALVGHHIPVDNDLIRFGDFDERSGYEATRSLLAEPDTPTAVFVASDEVALGALEAARTADVRVPDQLAVVGFDDLPSSRLISPSLTTVRVPARDLGAAAARMLLERIELGTRPSSIFLDTELIVRESSGRELLTR